MTGFSSTNTKALNFICAYCFSRLKRQQRSYKCTKCRQVFSEKRGILDFVPKEEKQDELYDFYDHVYISKNTTLDFTEAQWKAQILSSVMMKNRNKKPLKVLEIGCGSGEVLAEFSKIVPIKQGVGIDLSLKHLQFAKKRNPQFQYVQASASHLPFPGKSFDIVIMADLLEHVANVEEVITEAKRVSKSMLIKVPLEGCIEGYALHKMVPLHERYGHIQNFTFESMHRHIRKNGRKIPNEILLYTPTEFITFSVLPLRAKFFHIVRKLLRYGGIHFYRRFSPVWYVALVE